VAVGEGEPGRHCRLEGGRQIMRVAWT
jgi:hypothetical protein